MLYVSFFVRGFKKWTPTDLLAFVFQPIIYVISTTEVN